MCQLLGMNANVNHDIVFSFTGFSVRAQEHKDGFGVAFFEERGVRSFLDTQSADQSPVARMLREYPIRSATVIAHIRKATQGAVTLENTHPFIRELWGRYWVFAHNGDLKNFSPRLHGSFRPVGRTDSELAFCWLMQELNKAHASVPSTQELRYTLQELVPQIAKHGTFNMMLSNGEELWTHCSTRLHYLIRQHPFGSATLQDKDLRVDFAKATSLQDRVAIVVTEPLTTDEEWVQIAPHQLTAFCNGLPA